MEIIKRIGLFLSSFVPLFFLLIIKEVVEILNSNWTLNFLNTFFLIILGMMLIIGVVSLLILLKDVNVCDCEYVKITSKTNTTDQHFLGYFSLFVLFAISFEIEMCSMALVFFIVLSMIGIVYIKNDMYFINPLLNILGYSFYDIEYTTNENKLKNAKAFYKGPIIINQNYYMCTKYSKLFFIKKSKKV